MPQLGSLPKRPPLQISRRGLIVGGACCATVAATLAGLTLATRQQSYSTAHGEMRRVALEDGSVAEINTDTAFDVTMSRRLRRVRLQRGEAWFTVAKDRERPFVVEASDIRVAAIGTAFSVYDAGDHTDVLVTEGVIEAWRGTDKEARVRVAAGSRLRVGLSGFLMVTEAAEGIARDLAWRSGQIDLAGRSLEEAVAEFNRYNRRGIYIDDPALARQTLVGLFRTNEPESFARSVALAFGASLTQTPQAIRLGVPTPSN